MIIREYGSENPRHLVFFQGSCEPWQEFQAAGVDPMFRICEAGIRQKLFDNAFSNACNTLLKNSDPDFEIFRKRFEKDETQKIVSSVYTFMLSLPDPEEWLEMACGGVPEQIDSSHPWFRYAGEIVREKLNTASILLRQQYRMFDEDGHLEQYRDVWAKDSELFHVKQLWTEGQEVQPEQLDMPFCRMPGVRGLNLMESGWKSRYEEIRKKLKKLNEDIGKLIFPDPERISGEFRNMKESLAALRKIILLTMENFEQAKLKMRVLDFQDLEHKSLKILRSAEYRQSVQQRWKYIFVDECQDVSAVQDAIIQALLGDENSLFMVGDVKQSIYRFRLADPMIFMRRSREYLQPDTEGDCLSLQMNFRSRPEILETANTVFRDVMRESTAEMDYTPQEELIPGLEAEGNFPVMVDLLEPVPEMEYQDTLAEYIAGRARELRNEGFNYRDMVILMQKVSTDAPKLVEALAARNIPVFFDGGADRDIEGADRILVNSPKVATYDLKPEMSAFEVKDKVVAAILSEKYDTIILNFANCDMVGHTGVIPAAVKAVEAVDTCVGEVVAVLDKVGGVALITADHGNAEKLLDEDGKPYTAHTTNPVPVVVTDKNIKLRDGILSDIAPTLLELLELPIPEEMTSKSLIVK